MFAVGIIAFSMFRFAGDPVNQIVSIDTPPAEREAVRKSLGLDDPVIVQFARYFGNAVQFKFGISYQFRQPVSNLLIGAHAGDAGACDLRHHHFHGVRHPDGRLHRAQARYLACESLPGGIADRHIAADLPDRHPADLSVRGDAGLAAVVRPRRGRQARLVDHGPAHRLRAEGDHHARDHARPVPDDADHAAGARRDAGSAAHRLHPLRPRPRAHHPRHPFRPCAEEHAGSRHHRGRPAVWNGYCIFDHHRDRVPVARHGADVRAGRANRRYPDHGSLSADRVADLRHHQPGGRHPLHRRRSAPALDDQPRTPEARLECPTPSSRTRPNAAHRMQRRHELAAPRARQRHLPFLHPLADDDDRRRRDGAVLPAGDLRAAAGGAEPVRSGPAAADELAHLAAVDRRRPEPVPARHRRAGPRRAFRHSLRPAHFAHRRRARHAARRHDRHYARPRSQAMSAAPWTA